MRWKPKNIIAKCFGVSDLEANFERSGLEKKAREIIKTQRP